MTIRAWALAVALGLTGVAAQAAPLIGPWPVADPSPVLVLGTPHLSGMDKFDPAWLAPLLDRLAAWKPRVITIEGLSGPECYLLRRYDKSWPDTANDYCSRTEKLAALVKASTGLDMPAAEAAAEEAVVRLGPDPTPGARRHLAALFAGAGNLGSATVQWLRLPRAERKAGDGVSPELVAELDQLAIRKNENYLIAAALAARLGLERVYPADDHFSDRVQAEAPPGQDKAMQAIWSGERPPLAKQAQAMEAGLKDGACCSRFIASITVPMSARRSGGRTWARPMRQSRPNISAAAMSPGGRRGTCIWSPTSARRWAIIRASARS